MVVSSLMQIAAAGPIGALFGLAYGTSIRIGYEIIFPALFGDKVTSKDVDGTLQKMTETFTAVGGLEAQKFGVNVGIKNALKAINADAELMDLIKKNSSFDTLNITVNSSGILEQPGSSTSPPLLDLENEIAKVRSRYGMDWLHRAGDTPIRDIATLLQREKTYLQGDKECVLTYGKGWRITGSLQNCKNAEGQFRPLSKPFKPPSPDEPSITRDEKIEHEKKHLAVRLSTPMVEKLSKETIILKGHLAHLKGLIFRWNDSRKRESTKRLTAGYLSDVNKHQKVIDKQVIYVKFLHDKLQKQLKLELSELHQH